MRCYEAYRPRGERERESLQERRDSLSVRPTTISSLPPLPAPREKLTSLSSSNPCTLTLPLPKSASIASASSPPLTKRPTDLRRRNERRRRWRFCGREGKGRIGSGGRREARKEKEKGDMVWRCLRGWRGA